MKCKIETRLSRNRIDDTERKVERFQHRPLLDMDLEIGFRFDWIGGAGGIEAVCADGLPNVLPPNRVADESAAPDERHAEADTFFFRKSDRREWIGGKL